MFAADMDDIPIKTITSAMEGGSYENSEPMPYT